MMSDLAHFVGVRDGKDVRIDRPRTDERHAYVVLEHFCCQAVEITLST